MISSVVKTFIFQNQTFIPDQYLPFFFFFFRLYNVSTASSKQTINFKIVQETSQKKVNTKLCSLKSEFIILGFLIMEMCTQTSPTLLTADSKNNKTLLSRAGSPLNDSHWCKKRSYNNKMQNKGSQIQLGG